METVFKVGDRVFHILYGWGEVYCFTTSYVEVLFSSEKRYFEKGSMLLSFTEYNFQGFSQERPIILPEVGELCLMRDSDDEDWKAFMFKEYNSKYLFPFITKRGFAFKQMKRIKILD